MYYTVYSVQCTVHIYTLLYIIGTKRFTSHIATPSYKAIKNYIRIDIEYYFCGYLIQSIKRLVNISFTFKLNNYYL